LAQMRFKLVSLLTLFFGTPFIGDLPKLLQSRQQEMSDLVKASVLEGSSSNKGAAVTTDALELSKQIVRAAQCVEIDPIILTSLIWRESHFHQESQSETGAVGLTQLTKTGIHEVLDRLGADSPRRRDSLRNSMQNCYPQLLAAIPNQNDALSLYEWKKKVASSSTIAIVFGAALLKINFTSDYRVALEKYNGDPKVKVQFATDVMILRDWISSSFMVFPQPGISSSKFLASIQGP